MGSAARLVSGSTPKKGFQHLFEFLKGFPVDTVAGFCSFYSALDQSGLQEFFKMLRYGTLRQGQYFYNFPTNAGVSPGEFFQNRNPGRMCQRFRQFCEFLFRFAKGFFFVGGHDGLLKTHRKVTMNFEIVKFLSKNLS